MMKNKFKIIAVILFISGGLFYNKYYDNRRKKLLSKNTNYTIAIFDGYTVFRNVGPQSFFNFYVKRTKYKIQKHGRFEFLQKGDTVLIEYSIEDPSVGNVIDFCYMKKHKGKDYCNCLDE